MYTASVPDCAHQLFIPPIAHVCRQTREESLNALYKHRPVDILLFSPHQLLLALKSLHMICAQPRVYRHLIFPGAVKTSGNAHFYIRLRCSDKEPFFEAHLFRGASALADGRAEGVRKEMMKRLRRKVEISSPGHEGELSHEELARLMRFVWGESQSGRRRVAYD